MLCPKDRGSSHRRFGPRSLCLDVAKESQDVVIHGWRRCERRGGPRHVSFMGIQSFVVQKRTRGWTDVSMNMFEPVVLLLLQLCGSSLLPQGGFHPFHWVRRCGGNGCDTSSRMGFEPRTSRCHHFLKMKASTGQVHASRWSTRHMWRRGQGSV